MQASTGRVALVTGAAVGIGRATALALAREGADVAVHCHASTDEAANVASEMVEALGRRAVVVQADLTRHDEVTRTVAAVDAALGPIDILNNAGGLLARRPMIDMSEAFFRDVMDVNVLSMFLCCQAVAPGMIARKAGAIVNLTSLAAHNGGGPGASVYAAAKAAVLALTKAYRRNRAARHSRQRGVARADRRHAVPHHLHQPRGVCRHGEDDPARAGRRARRLAWRR